MIKLVFRLSAVAVAFVLCGCENGRVSANEATPKPQQFIVVVDLSASRLAAMETDSREFLHDLVGQLTFGDEMVLLQMQQSGLQDHPRRWSGQMPVPSSADYVSARDTSHLKAARTGMTAAVDSFFNPNTESSIQHTDILTTLHLASESMHDSQGRPSTVLLLSDMLQSAQGIEMDKLARMPRPGWINQQRQMGLIPSFTGACVVVVGADATNVSGMQIRRFWQDYFAAAGSPLKEQEYRATPPSVTRNLCG
jgi:hypothetical protein